MIFLLKEQDASQKLFQNQKLDNDQIVLLNVEGSIGMKIVQSLLCIDLLLTYPVVMRQSIGIFEEHWKGMR